MDRGPKARWLPTLMRGSVEAGCEPGLCTQQTSLVRDFGRQLRQPEAGLDCIFNKGPGAALAVSRGPAKAWTAI